MVTIDTVQVESMGDGSWYFNTEFVFSSPFYHDFQCHCKFGLVFRMLCIFLSPYPILMIAQVALKGIGDKGFGLLQMNSLGAFPCVAIIDPLDFD